MGVAWELGWKMIEDRVAHRSLSTQGNYAVRTFAIYKKPKTNYLYNYL